MGSMVKLAAELKVDESVCALLVGHHVRNGNIKMNIAMPVHKDDMLQRISPRLACVASRRIDGRLITSRSCLSAIKKASTQHGIELPKGCVDHCSMTMKPTRSSTHSKMSMMAGDREEVCE